MRQTQKLRYAVSLYQQLKLNRKYSSQEELYTLMNEHNYHWDSQQKKWLHGGTPDPASTFVKIRVMTDRANVTTIVSEIKTAMSDKFICLETSDIYPCRPPKQNDARIYLTFTPNIVRKLSLLPQATDAVMGSCNA